ncbi:hypothetical protein HanXRQr2_Chr17g0795691 [Helianthus annuus]|uniref:Uncharacterized protein n=1 Tax=Helianthus annuus TaxID=4232 RepID=A0A9K3DIP7_HELAN|nr:hypothetical protein HanXRQr2_Chr17g0795691 [Helianthus annuus]KAJ0812579.1 hypothetical protein HanPSC8_Chr17g0763561 [Helianthus annuus]
MIHGGILSTNTITETATPPSTDLHSRLEVNNTLNLKHALHLRFSINLHTNTPTRFLRWHHFLNPSVFNLNICIRL